MSKLRKALEEYLAVRRTLGFELREVGGLLGNFISFLEQHGASHITTELALCWAKQPLDVQPAHWARRLGIVRGFAQHHTAVDPRTEIPPQGLLPYHYLRRAPYVYSDREIAELIAAPRTLASDVGLRPWTYATLFALIAVTGMRISEPIGLDRDDVDLAQGVLTVRGTKFGKSRLIPIHPSTRRALCRYGDLRDSIHPKPTTPSFFVSDRGRRLSHWIVRKTFVKLSCQIGLRGPSDSRGPRLHDLRHRFAVRTLLRWYRAHVDVDRHMPELATYLGHAHMTDTYWYLSAVPELLRLAARRLERPAGGRRP